MNDPRIKLERHAEAMPVDATMINLRARRVSTKITLHKRKPTRQALTWVFSGHSASVDEDAEQSGGCEGPHWVRQSLA